MTGGRGPIRRQVQERLNRSHWELRRAADGLEIVKWGGLNRLAGANGEMFSEADDCGGFGGLLALDWWPIAPRPALNLAGLDTI